MMRKVKKHILLFLTVLLCVQGFNARIHADEEDPKTDQSYTASYEFVMDDGSDVPDCLLELLPEKKTYLKSGDVVTNEPIKDVETEESVFSFVSWNYNRYEIEGSDVVFTGTWKKADKTMEDLEEERMIKISYVFAEAYSIVTNNLTKEIMELLPEGYKESAEKSHVPMSPEVTKVGDYEFEGWNPYVDPDTGDITYQGIWISPDSKWVKPAAGLLRAGAAATFSFDGAWSVPNSVGYSGSSRFMLDGEQAYCIEPGVHMDNSYIGASYSMSGSQGGEIARIIVMGTYRGVDPGSIQAAVWNAIRGTSAGGETCQPSYSGYDATGWRYGSLSVYSSGSLQRLVANIPSPTPDYGYLNLRKVSSDSGYDYKSLPNNYSLGGAVYGVYTDQACTNLAYRLTTNSSGNSNTLTFSESSLTFYIREITPSKGFKMDETVYTAKVSRGSTTTITSKEVPYSDPIEVLLYKKNARDMTRVRYLEEAQFTLRYYDTQEDDVSGMKPKYTWVFRPIFNESGVAEIIFDEDHYVSGDPLILDHTGTFYLPLGTFTIQETKAPQTYQIDPNEYVGHIYLEEGEIKVRINGGEWLEIENLSLSQSEREVMVRTTAIFEENGLHRYFADGVAHIIDIVDYDYLIPGEEYTLKAKLILKAFEEILWTQDDFENGDCTEEEIGTVRERILKEDECEEVMEAEAAFVPEEESGQASVRFDGIDFDEKANNEYVVYEYLYLSSDLENLITYHEDINDEGQTVNIDELYRADFILYKIGDGNKSIRLNGAYFDVKTSRTKRDGRVIEKELGTFVTGGIYLQREEPFRVTVYEDEECTTSVKEYESKWDNRFKKDAVTILDLEEGTYYAKVEGEEEVSVHQVAKGTIFLPLQEEDTQITFTELVAPQGYYLDRKPFVMTVGHDYELLEVENYRSNSMIIIPNTGYDGD